MPTTTQFLDGEVTWQTRGSAYQGNYVGPRSIGVDTSNTDLIANGSIIVREADGNAALHVANGNVLGLVRNTKSPDDVTFRDLYKPSATAACLEYQPIDNIDLNVCEDGVGGVIADWTATPYVDLTAQSLTGNTGATGEAFARGIRVLRYIDSSTAASSAGSLSWQIVAVDETFINSRPPGNTTAVKRYIIQPVAAKQQVP